MEVRRHIATVAYAGAALFLLALVSLSYATGGYLFDIGLFAGGCVAVYIMIGGRVA